MTAAPSEATIGRSLHRTLRHLAAYVLFIGAGCARAPAPDPIPPHQSLSIDSIAVGEQRHINVYLPDGYAAGDLRYPVLYMPDGGVEEDFPHIANTVDALIAGGRLAPMLVVGIENTERRRDLTPSSTTKYDLQFAPPEDGASAFRAFIRDELMPQIDRDYRTDGRTAIVGESLAGLFVVDTFLREPTLFDRYVAMDPSLWWDDHRLVREASTRLDATSARVLWFASSRVKDIAPHTASLAEVLTARAPADLRWKYEPHPREHHHTIFRATKDAGFQWALWHPGSG